MMHVLRDRCDHRQCDVGTFTDATDNMIGRDACDARFAYSFGGSHVSIAGECVRLRETLALCHNFDHGFIAGRSTAIKFYPTVDHDKKRSRRIVLALSLIHISEPTRLGMISYAVFCLKKKNK